MNLNREPVAISAAIRAVIMAGVAFGLGWTAEQVVAFMFAVESVLAVVVRQQVTPTAKLTPAMRKRVSEKGQTQLWTILLVLLIVLVVVLLVGPITIGR